LWNGNPALGDIHGAGASSSGTCYNPDKSAIPSGSDDLGSLVGGPANGIWTVFVSDPSGAGLTTVQSWGLQMDIVAVQEVGTWIAAHLFRGATSMSDLLRVAQPANLGVVGVWKRE